MRVLVTGPESSGNRMLCRMLIEAGAKVLHRPMPTSTHWRAGMDGNPTNWDGVWSNFATLEWDAAVVIQRDLWPVLETQVRQGHVDTEADALRRTRQALVYIYAQLGGTSKPWWPMTYEAFARPETLERLCGVLGLDYSLVETRWQDANAKHYGGEPWDDNRRLNETHGHGMV